MAKKPEFLLALDVSTSTIGIALFEDLGFREWVKKIKHNENRRLFWNSDFCS
jgi:RNase H-fold protein (predicted Holliday junction resolvase)